MDIQRKILNKILYVVEPSSYSTAYYKGSSIGNNAVRHHNASWLLKVDIENFFDSIKNTHIKFALNEYFPHLSIYAIDEIIELCTVDGHLPQGAPTSPHIANIVMYKFDHEISEICSKLDCIYSRYADDISISSSNERSIEIINLVIRSKILEMNMKINDKKMKIIGPNKRKIVTGIDINANIIRPSRVFRKKTMALVRMSEKYPSKMTVHYKRIMGYIAHWEGCCIGAGHHDPELVKIKTKMLKLTKAKRYDFKE